MKVNLKSYLLVIVFVFFLISLAEPLMMRSTLFIGEASAHAREFEVDLNIPVNGTQALTFEFNKGDEMEIIFTFQVEQELPVDVWFVDLFNYGRLVDAREFLYFIDGSGQQITQASKIVSVTQSGAEYILVFANYNDEPVDVHLAYDVNVYPPEPEEETPFWQSTVFLAVVALLVGILIGLAVSRISRRSEKAAGKKPSKKDKKRKGKKAKSKDKKKKSKKAKKPKSKETEPEISEEEAAEEESEAAEDEEAEEVEEEVVEDEEAEEVEEEPSAETEEVEEEPEIDEEATSPSFCGHCGKAVETAFCPFCGKEVKKA